jgi:hypothetical protein
MSDEEKKAVMKATVIKLRALQQAAGMDEGDRFEYLMNLICYAVWAIHRKHGYEIPEIFAAVNESLGSMDDKPGAVVN